MGLESAASMLYPSVQGEYPSCTFMATGPSSSYSSFFTFIGGTSFPVTLLISSFTDWGADFHLHRPYFFHSSGSPAFREYSVRYLSHSGYLELARDTVSMSAMSEAGHMKHPILSRPWAYHVL